MPSANTPQLWDTIWDQLPATTTETLQSERLTIRWSRLSAILQRTFPEWAGLRVIELGAGEGTYGALLAAAGASVTLLDYSDHALERAEAFYNKLALPVQLIKADALNLPTTLHEQFSVAFSFGLAEHFRDERRQQILRAHYQVLRPGGLFFVSVPNAFCPPYRIFKMIATLTGKWIFGEEYPFTRGELHRAADQLGAQNYGVFGGSFGASWDFINPLKASAWVRHILRVQDRPPTRPERGTPLDAYLSYALVLWAQKPPTQVDPIPGVNR
jgi:SAM-dependent methyltransferase